MITERFHKVLIRPLKLSDAEKSWQWRNDQKYGNTLVVDQKQR